MRRIGLKQSLLLAIALPMVGLLFFAFGNIAEHFTTWRQSEDMKELIGIAGQFSAVVHEVQKERGASAGYLGAHGAKFGPKLQKQRVLTDKETESLRESLNDLDPALASKAFGIIFQTAMSMLDQVEVNRAQNDILKIDLDENLGFYTTINTFLLTSISKLAQVPFHPTITKDLIAFATFLHSKELAGIERALLSNVFGAGNFKGREQLHERLLKSVVIQENFSLAFLSVAGKRQQDFFRSSISDAAFEKAKAIREVGLAGLQASDLGLDARYWFDLQTEKINVLKKIEDHLHQLMLEDTKAIGNEAKWRFVVHLAVTILLLVGGAFFGRQAIRLFDQGN